MILTFGKYKDKEINDVAIEDPNYIFWMLENDVMDIPEHIIELANQHLSEDIGPDNEMLYGYDWGDRD